VSASGRFTGVPVFQTAWEQLFRFTLLMLIGTLVWGASRIDVPTHRPG
jgi:hypothetical protein